jgi:hypothetical protein
MSLCTDPDRRHNHVVGGRDVRDAVEVVVILWWWCGLGCVCVAFEVVAVIMGMGTLLAV